MSSEIAVKVENLSKRYEIYQKPGDRLKQFLVPRVQRIFGFSSENYYREFWALRDVSFEVFKGETVGIVGRNGSGKSTLLQMICGTLNPTSGHVYTHGRIAALLELGSGFNPEFTGRENVYMNAALLGLSRSEIENRFDDIVAFADIGVFIDQPVKTFSSGMVVRLAFAVQAQVEPDVLIVDEALAVGDAKFQAKCFARLNALKNNGTSILLVTHSSEQVVTHCSKAVLLDLGCCLEIGEPRHIVNLYMDKLFGRERKLEQASSKDMPKEDSRTSLHSELSLNADLFSQHPNYNPGEYRWGDGTASIVDFYMSAGGVDYPASVASGDMVLIAISIRFHESLLLPILGFTLKTKEGVTIYGANSETLKVNGIRQTGEKGTVAIAKMAFTCNLAPGDYFISLGIATKNGEEVFPHDRRYDSIHLQVQPVDSFFGLVDLDVKLELESVLE